MAKIELSSAEVKAVADELNTAAGAPPRLFCQSWPVAKQVIVALGKTSNAWVKLAINLVLQVGNALYKGCQV